MASTSTLPATDSSTDLHTLIGDDSTAVFESDPNFLGETPAASASSENLSAAKSADVDDDDENLQDEVDDSLDEDDEDDDEEELDDDEEEGDDDEEEYDEDEDEEVEDDDEEDDEEAEDEE